MFQLTTDQFVKHQSQIRRKSHISAEIWNKSEMSSNIEHVNENHMNIKHFVEHCFNIDYFVHNLSNLEQSVNWPSPKRLKQPPPLFRSASKWNSRQIITCLTVPEQINHVGPRSSTDIMLDLLPTFDWHVAGYLFCYRTSIDVLQNLWSFIDNRLTFHKYWVLACMCIVLSL